jgi:hypothetical protein
MDYCAINALLVFEESKNFGWPYKAMGLMLG